LVPDNMEDEYSKVAEKVWRALCKRARPLRVEFAIAAMIVLSILELVHIVSLGTWKSEIFEAIGVLILTVTSLFLGARTWKNRGGGGIEFDT